MPEFALAHVVCSRMTAEKRLVLRALFEREGGFPACLVQVGSGQFSAPGLPAPRRLPALLDFGWLGARALRGALDEFAAGGGAKTVLVHVWSPGALSWCVPLASERRGVLCDVDVDWELPRAARWFAARRAGAPVVFVCPTQRCRQRLLERGVPAAHTALVRPHIDFAALAAAQRERVPLRARLGLKDDQCAIGIVPPITRATGAFVAMWAVLLLEKIRPDVRLIVPCNGPERDRLARLVRSCRHEFATPGWDEPLTTAAALTAADLAVFLPPDDAPLSGLAWALAAGRPIIASAIPAVTELLAHGQNALLARPDDPKDAARRLLQALEQPEAARRLAERARGDAFRLFSRQRMIEQYDRVYANLAAQRPVDDGVTDPLLAL